jgi:thiamine-phosphate diphosphorylase
MANPDTTRSAETHSPGSTGPDAKLERVNIMLSGDEWRITLHTSRVSATLILRRPSQPSMPNDGRVTAAHIASAIAFWREQTYVLEDACVLALFEVASGSASTADFLRGPHLDHRDMPIWRDTRGDRSYPTPTSAFPAMRDPAPGIYPIVEDLNQLQCMLDAGARILQLRIKSERLTHELRHTIAMAIRTAERYPECQLFINDHWEAALASGAYGVHLGQEDLLVADLAGLQRAGLRLGVSSHSFWEVARALSLQPSYVACGPLFPTRAKAMPWIPQGIDNLRYWVRLLPQPVIGIGGVQMDRLAAIRHTGCAAASVIQAIVSDADPADAFRRLQQLWTKTSTPDLASASECPALARPTLHTPAGPASRLAPLNG